MVATVSSGTPQPLRRPVTEVLGWARRRMVAHGDVEGFGYAAAGDAPFQLHVPPGADPKDYPVRVGGWRVQLLLTGGTTEYSLVDATGPEVIDPTRVDPVVD